MPTNPTPITQNQMLMNPMDKATMRIATICGGGSNSLRGILLGLTKDSKEQREITRDTAIAFGGFRGFHCGK